MKKDMEVKKGDKEKDEKSKKGPKPFLEETINCAWCGKPNLITGIKETITAAVPAQRRTQVLVEKETQKKLNEE